MRNQQAPPRTLWRKAPKTLVRARAADPNLWRLVSPGAILIDMMQRDFGEIPAKWLGLFLAKMIWF
jgi:hypothetical protein